MTERRPVRRSATRQERASPRSSLSALLLVPAIFTTILGSLPTTHAYIPARPINDTSRLNLTDTSTIGISWVLPAGVYTGPVYVLPCPLSFPRMKMTDRVAGLISFKRIFRQEE